VIGNYILLFVLGFLAWLALTWSIELGSVLAGLAVALVAALIFGKMLILNLRKAFSIQRYFWFLYYTPIFLWELIKANMDVAYRVLHPKLPINPGIVKIKTNLKSELSQTVLANSITLTPGTMTVDIKGDEMYVHWIDVRDKETEKATAAIAGRFEKIIARIFE
jgi:multicomponent Na+:H+ antiporter subunit E